MRVYSTGRCNRVLLGPLGKTHRLTVIWPVWRKIDLIQVERESHEANAAYDASCAAFLFSDTTTITFPADNQDSRRNSRALVTPEDASPPESPPRGTKGPARKDAEKRREQNRAA